MNLLIALVILLCLGVSELRTPELAEHVGQRLVLLAMAALVVPGVALFQTVVVTRNCRARSFADAKRQPMLRRLSACHSAVWLTASVAIVWGLRWPDIVRVNWQLAGWPLIDDLLILAPILLSLVFSWAIFYDVQRSLGSAVATSPAGGTSRWSWDLAIPQRTRFVSVRFRVYVLMSLIPILAMFALRDASVWAEHLPVGWQNVGWLLGGLVVLAIFPLLMMLAWKHEPVRDKSLRLKMLACCRRLKLGIWQIRVWDTGNQLINAFVTGVFPGLRVIAISDRMVDQFPQRELLAVLRHEAGHIRLCHVPIRMLVMVLPLVGAAIDQAYGSVVMAAAFKLLEQSPVTVLSPLAWAAVAYVIYLLPVLAWLSRRMEFEADWFSAATERRSDLGELINDQHAQHNGMTLAIARLAAHSPEQYERRTIMHPSLRERMQRTANMKCDMTANQQLAEAFARRRMRWVYGSLGIVAVIALANFVMGTLL